PIGLHQLKQEATKAPEKKKAASEEGAEEVLYEELFGVDEISVVTAMPVQTQERVRPPADSGEVAIAIQFEEGAESMPLPLTTAEARKLVNSTYLGVHDRTHYELLGVEPSASTARIREACETLRKTFAVERFKDCDLGLDHPKLEEINYMISQAEAVLLDAKARARYDEELKESARAGKPDPIEAEMLLRSGETLIAQGHFAQAVSALARAVELDPESPDCWAALGWARHGAKPGDQEVGIEAERDIERALTLSPDDPHALRYLGLLRAALGQDDRAISALERALDIDPGRKDVFEALAGIHAARGDWKLLERQHRLVLHRLGSRDASRTVALWKSLAAVYRDQLGDIESARTSLEVAAKLAPTDEEIQGALEALQRPDPGRWRERAEVLLGQLSKQPAERAPLEELFRLYSAVEQPDRAYLAASLLARHGAMDQGAQDLLRRFQPRFLLRVRRDVDGEIWSRIRHLQDDPETCTLFETLATLPPDFDFEAAPVDDIGQPVEPDSTPATFGRVLSYLCGLLALPTPPLRQRARRQGEEEGPCRVLGPIASQLMVEDALLASEDALAIAIHLSRVLPYFWAGRAFGAALGPKELRNVLMAAMKVISPRLKTDDPGGSIGRIHERLMQAPAEFREGLTGVITALTRERSSLNITRWIKGMAISADRLALVIVADPELLLRHHPAGSSAEIVEEIQSYALSEPHLELRALLGTSVVV
ncbi:MAG: tetratricopeptide repeat protein, partial [Polyangia bacterium]|nr:tetratricopeptide repeat protein [Polyangia bacterium]